MMELGSSSRTMMTRPLPGCFRVMCVRWLQRVRGAGTIADFFPAPFALKSLRVAEKRSAGPPTASTPRPTARRGHKNQGPGRAVEGEGVPPPLLRTSEAAPEAVRQAVGGGCPGGWGRLLSATKAIEAGACRQGDCGWA